MKKILSTILGIALLASFQLFTPVQAACTPIAVNFPTSLDTFQSGNCIASSLLNNLETKIGVNNSTATSSLDYQVRNITSSTITVTGSVTSTIFGTPSSSYILNLNTHIQFPTPSQLATNGCSNSPSTTDPFTCLQYLYNNAPSGVEIDVPTGNYTGSGSFSALTADKNVVIQCVGGGGSVFNETATTGIAMNFGSGSASHVGDGILGCKLNGPNSGTGIGIEVGGSNANAGEGFLMKDDYLTHFYQNIVTTNNVYLFAMDHVYSRFNATNSVGGGLLYIQNGSNDGETIGIGDGTLFSDAQPAAYGVEIQVSGESNVEIDPPCSIDDAQVYINQYGGQGNNVHIGCHMENPAGDSIPSYIPIIFNPGNAYLNDALVLDKASFQNDAVTNTPACDISLYGQLSMFGVAFDGNAYSSGPLPNAVCLGNPNSTIYSSGAVFGGSDGTTGFPGATNLYNDPNLGEIPITAGLQTYNVTSTYSGGTIFYQTPQDGAGNFFVTSTKNLYVNLGTPNAPVAKQKCVASNNGSGTSLNCTLSGVSAGDAIIVAGNKSATITDTMGNTYTSAVNNNGQNIFYATNVTATTTFVIHSTFSAGTFSFLSAFDYSGLATSSMLDVSTSSFYSSLNKNTIFTSGTSTLSQAGDLVFGYAACNDAAGVVVAVTPYKTIQTNPSGGCDTVQSNIFSTTGSQSAVFLLGPNGNNGDNATALMAAFKPALPPLPPTYNIAIGSSTQPTTLFVNDINNNSSTLRIGGGISRFSCVEMNDSVNSSTLTYNFPTSGIWTTTTTKPNFCE
jgi:hypothetical protein